MVGKELRRRRKEKKLTQIALSVESGLSQNMVGRIERGVHNPTIVVLHALAVRLGITISDLTINIDSLKSWPGLQNQNSFPTAWVTELRWRRV